MIGSPDPRIDNTVVDVAAAMRLARKKDALGRVVSLIGAGCSVTAKVPGAAAVARRMVRDVGEFFGCGPAGADDVALYAALVARKRLDPCVKGDLTAPPTEATVD